MALTGAHIAGDPGHVADHNLIDTGLSTKQPTLQKFANLAAAQAAVTAGTVADGELVILLG